MAKAKRKTSKGKGNDGTLETILRFEIIVVLFSLIGLYYFLSFSPIRMPVEPISSPPETIAPLPPRPESKVESGIEAESSVAGSVTAPATVVAVLPPARPIVASVPTVGAEAEMPPEQQLSPAPDTGASETIPETESSASGITAPAGSSRNKMSTDLVAATLPESNNGLAPVTAASSQVSQVTPLALKPEIAPAPLKKVAQLTLLTRTIVAGEYVLQVDSRHNREKLEALKFKVKTEVVRRPTPMFRVYLGTFPRQKKAVEMMAIVRKKGDDPFLQACSGGYNVVIGSFYLRSSVVAWENMYHAAGFEPKVQEVTLKMPHTLLLLDGPEVQQDPEAVLARLQAAGFANSHLK